MRVPDDTHVLLDPLSDSHIPSKRSERQSLTGLLSVPTSLGVPQSADTPHSVLTTSITNE